MTYKELHDLIPTVVHENFGELHKAILKVQELRDLATEKDKETADEVEKLINERIEKIAGEVDMLQKRIHQIALMAHSADGF